MTGPAGTNIEAFNVIENSRLCVNAGSKTAAGKCNKANNMVNNITTLEAWKDPEPI